MADALVMLVDENIIVEPFGSEAVALLTAQAEASEQAAAQSAAAVQVALAGIDPDEAAMLAEVALSSRGAAWKIDNAWLYTDRAGTIPVTAVGDLVGRIKVFGGSSSYDWVAPTDGERGQYFEAYGAGFVRMVNAKGFSINGISMRVPSFMALAAKYAGTTGRALMGFAKNTGSRHQISSASLSRADAAAQGGSDITRPEVHAYSAEFSAPSGPVAVYSSLLAADGTLDSVAEGSAVRDGLVEEPTTWVEGDTVTGMSLVLNGSGQALGVGTINADASLDFYGGVILGRAPGNRDAIVRWLQARSRPRITENDEVILIIGDSTGDDISNVPERIHEVFYRLASEDLVARRPSNCVILQDWSRVGDTTLGMERFSDGTLTRRTFVINCSSAGSQPGYFFAERFERIIGDLPHVNLAIFHHGQNLAVGDLTVQADPNRGLLKSGQYIDAIDQLRGRFPGARLMLVKPYPYGVDGDERIEPVKKAVEFVATKYPDAIVADYYTVFDTGTGGDSRPAAWYESDHVHPSSPTGVGKMYEVLSAAMDDYDALADDLYITPPLIDHRRILPSENLLSNGSFESWTAGVPDDWTLTGDAEVEKVGAKAEILAFAEGGLEQTIDAVPLRGKTVVVTVVQRITAESDVWAGGVRFRTDTGAIGDGRWVDQPYHCWDAERRFNYLFSVPMAASTLTVEIVAGLEGPGATHVSRAVLVEGEDPRDILI